MKRKNKQIICYTLEVICIGLILYHLKYNLADEFQKEKRTLKRSMEVYEKNVGDLPIQDLIKRKQKLLSDVESQLSLLDSNRLNLLDNTSLLESCIVSYGGDIIYRDYSDKRNLLIAKLIDPYDFSNIGNSIGGKLDSSFLSCSLMEIQNGSLYLGFCLENTSLANENLEDEDEENLVEADTGIKKGGKNFEDLCRVFKEILEVDSRA